MSFYHPEGARRSFETAYVNDPDEVCLVEQSHKDSCDINFLMSRYEGPFPTVNMSEDIVDFTGVSDYQTALNSVIESKELFMSLPARIRSRFDNDPGLMFAFLEDPKNFDEAVKLGICDPRPVPDATIRDVVEAVKATKPAVKKKPTE